MSSLRPLFAAIPGTLELQSLVDEAGSDLGEKTGELKSEGSLVYIYKVTKKCIVLIERLVANNKDDINKLLAENGGANIAIEKPFYDPAIFCQEIGCSATRRNDTFLYIAIPRPTMSDKMVFHAKSIRKGEDHGQTEEISRCSIVVVFQEVSFWMEPVGMVPYATVAYVNEE